MTRPLTTLIAILFAAAALAALALRPPTGRPADAPPTIFSAARAFPDVQAIAQRPHPIGSADSARVRGYLVGRLTQLGLETSVRPGPVVNILGVLPGRDRALPALVLMSHYDSVPTGPGAADDGAGVAAALETVRALKAAGPQRRDVMVLITDGEEAGLVGAKAFFHGDPMAARVGLIINLEARGNRGRAVMFETHRQAGGVIDLLMSRGALRGASSLMPDLYRRLPNDTDLTVALKAGKQGLNFAFFGEQAAYHTPEDRPDTLDQGSLQHIGDQALAAARVLAQADALPSPASDKVYGDLLGGPVISYPPVAGWGPIGIAALLIGMAAALALRRGQLTGLQLARGAAAWCLLAAMQVVALTLAAMWLAAGPQSFQGLLRLYPYVLAGCAALSAGATILVVSASGWSLGPWKATGPAPLWLGALLAGLLAAAALQAAAPFDAFMVAWPVVAGGAAAAIRQAWPQKLWAEAAGIAIVVLALAQIGYWAGLLFSLIGVAQPVVLAPFAALAALVAIPLAAEIAPGRAARLARVLIGAGGLLLGFVIYWR